MYKKHETSLNPPDGILLPFIFLAAPAETHHGDTTSNTKLQVPINAVDLKQQLSAEGPEKADIFTSQSEGGHSHFPFD